MNYSKSLILTSISFLLAISCSVRPSDEVIILDQPGYPFIFELDPGETRNVIRNYNGKTIKSTIKLNSFKSLMETNYWFNDSLGKKNYYQTDVELDISGQIVTLHHRPYQMPETVNGLRINIENIREWDEHGRLGKTGSMKKQVRIAVCMEGEPWGPESIIFPIDNYIWRAAVYNNTWSALVPFNLLYYHRGEDYGAIPDLLDVVSSIEGKITSTPVPDGPKGSNGVVIENGDGLTFRYAHMNFETIVKENIVGKELNAGDLLGKTGMTWNGFKSQHQDPHLHVELSVNDVDVNSFPYIMEAYLRKYSDKVIAIAGGYRFAVPGEKVELDASRSFDRNHLPLKSIQWKLSDGTIESNSVTSIIYNEPGIYTEELTVETEAGDTDRDFIYVTVYDTSGVNKTAAGWAYYYPVRGIKAGDKVLFWNRLAGTVSDVLINYGEDFSWEIIGAESKHIFKKAGKFVITLKSTGPGNAPVTLKMELVVEEK